MLYYKKLSQNKTVDITYINPSPSSLLDALESQRKGKRIAVLTGKKEKRTPRLKRSALEKICKVTGINVEAPKDSACTEQVCEAIKDILSIHGGVVCDDCMPDETVPSRDGIYLFCGDKVIRSSEVVFTTPTRSVRRPLY